jgi:hypothetical protein
VVVELAHTVVIACTSLAAVGIVINTVITMACTIVIKAYIATITLVIVTLVTYITVIVKGTFVVEDYSSFLLHHFLSHSHLLLFVFACSKQFALE